MITIRHMYFILVGTQMRQLVINLGTAVTSNTFVVFYLVVFILIIINIYYLL